MSSLIWSSDAFTVINATRESGFDYDPTSGLMTREVIEPNTQALRLQTDYGYDPFGNKTSATVSGVDIATRSTSATYDSKGRFVATVTNALGHSESWSYHPLFGAPTKHIGPNGLISRWDYDGFGRKILEVRPDGTRTKWDYQFCSGVNGGTAACPAFAVYLVQATPLAADGATQNGPIGTVYLDSLEREVLRDTQGFDGTHVQVATQYDDLGRAMKRSRPYFVGAAQKWTSYTYDLLARPLTETAPDGSVTKRVYQGLVVTRTDALGHPLKTRADSQGHVVAIGDALAKSMSFVYDGFDNLRQTTDQEGNVATATFDARGRKKTSSDPDLGSWSYVYDTLDQLVVSTDAKGQKTTASYDKLGRMIQRVEPDGASTWTYDTAAHGIGKLASEAVGAEFARSYFYDALARPVKVATSIGGLVYDIAGSYDANSRLASVTYPSGLRVTYRHSSLGDVTGLVDAASGQA